MASDTIFHKIASKEAPAYIIYEDENFMAFLDIFPSFYGQSIVIPKTPATSKFSEADPELMKNLVATGQKVARLLETKIDNIERCLAVFEGFDVDYLHLKLYPAGPDTRGQEVLYEPPTQAPEEELVELHRLLTS